MATPDPTTGADPGRDDPVRAEERRRLAHELNDAVAHHLANVALRTMDRPPTTDLGALRAVLADVNRASGAALAELRLLTHVLEDDPALLVRDDGVGALSRWPAPTDAAQQWRRLLSGAGRQARVRVPAAADQLALSVQSTIARLLDTTGAAALAHTASGARCSAVLRLARAEVALRTTVALPASPAGDEQELADVLRGLRERVHLSHGRLTADLRGRAPEPPAWVVELVLPLG